MTRLTLAALVVVGYIAGSMAASVLPAGVKVFKDCKGRNNGVYADGRDCRRYVHCWNQYSYVFRCYDGFVFNPCERRCVFRRGCVRAAECQRKVGFLFLPGQEEEASVPIPDNSPEDKESGDEDDNGLFEVNPETNELQSRVEVAPPKKEEKPEIAFKRTQDSEVQIQDEEVATTTMMTYLVRVVFGRNSKPQVHVNLPDLPKGSAQVESKIVDAAPVEEQGQEENVETIVKAPEEPKEEEVEELEGSGEEPAEDEAELPLIIETADEKISEKEATLGEKPADILEPSEPIEEKAIDEATEAPIVEEEKPTELPQIDGLPEILIDPKTDAPIPAEPEVELSAGEEIKPDLPQDGEELPAEGSENPAEGSELPSEGSDLLGEENEKPAEESELPAEGSEIPAEETELPAGEEDNKGEELIEDKPTEAPLEEAAEEKSGETIIDEKEEELDLELPTEAPAPVEEEKLELEPTEAPAEEEKPAEQPLPAENQILSENLPEEKVEEATEEPKLPEENIGEEKPTEAILGGELGEELLEKPAEEFTEEKPAEEEDLLATEAPAEETESIPDLPPPVPQEPEEEQKPAEEELLGESATEAPEEELPAEELPEEKEEPATEAPAEEEQPEILVDPLPGAVEDKIEDLPTEAPAEILPEEPALIEEEKPAELPLDENKPDELPLEGENEEKEEILIDEPLKDAPTEATPIEEEKPAEEKPAEPLEKIEKLPEDLAAVVKSEGLEQSGGVVIESGVDGFPIEIDEAPAPPAPIEEAKIEEAVKDVVVKEPLPHMCNITVASKDAVCQCPNAEAEKEMTPGDLQAHCEKLTCRNGGMYLALTSGHCGCVCTTGWAGDECQHLVEQSLCHCANGGKCVEVEGKYSCQCPIGYFGAQCQYDVEKITPRVGNLLSQSFLKNFEHVPGKYKHNVLCGNNRCRNDGICLQNYRTGRNQCFCPDGFTGRFCQRPLY